MQVNDEQSRRTGCVGEFSDDGFHVGKLTGEKKPDRTVALLNINAEILKALAAIK